ncbi:MAG: UDP-3-O-(3-hydroxymyristoyl)glucosamine N-acyltransferase, partial [Steroidobacteraceae bacterium]
MFYSAEEIAQAIGARLAGDSARQITGVSNMEAAQPNQLIFVEDPARLEAALASQAGAVVAGEFAAGAKTAKALLLVSDPRLGFARAARILHPPNRQATGIHSSAVMHRSSRIGKAVSIGPNAVLGEDCVIGDRTRIGPGTCIGNGVALGSDCFIDNNVTLYSGTRLGDRVSVHAGAVLGSAGFGYVRDAATGKYELFPQVGRLEIGDDVEIGANVTIDRGALQATIIGNGVKIDNLVHIAHNVRVGDNVVIAALTGISGSSVIESNVIVGGQVGIGDHAHVEEGVVLGSGSGVLTKKIVRGKGVVFWGRPARPLKEYLKELAALARLAKKE